MLLSLYRILTSLGRPLIEIYLQKRLKKGKEDKARFEERRGVSSFARPDGRLAWLHGASVGEAVSLLPLIERLVAEKGWRVLLTTGTVTSARLMEQRLPKGAIHQYVPVDCPGWVASFLDHWRPDLALWVESEFWPNLILETKARSVPMVLLNGRISDRSLARWRRYSGTIRTLLSCFSLCLAQSKVDAERLVELGAKQVACPGNLKFAAPPLPVDEAKLETFRRQSGNRPCWLAASTHEGEEALAASIHQALSTVHPGLLTIIAPRHPPRAIIVQQELEAMGLRVACLSSAAEISPDTDILLGDTMGEMGLLYRLAPIAFIGKSLIGAGGQNPLEPARLGVSVLFGPNMSNFAKISQDLQDNGAAHRIEDQESLQDAIDQRLADPALAAEEGALAQAFALAQNHILDDIVEALSPWLEGKGDHRESA